LEKAGSQVVQGSPRVRIPEAVLSENLRRVPHEILLASRDGVLRIPSYALLEGNRVLVARGGALEARAVEVGLKNWQFAEVVRGLSAGDAVAVSLDRPEVKEGARVRIEAESKK